MPIGSFACVPAIVQNLIQQQPRRVLDLGIGFGGNGSAIREWLDLGIQPWKTFLVGVEAWADYRNPVWDLYNLVIATTIEDYFVRYSDLFDAVLFTDVIEHFEKAAGGDVLQRAQQRVARGGLLIVTTPAVFFEQAAVSGNALEVHRSIWSEDEFRERGFETQVVGDKRWFCGEAIIALWRAD